MATCSAPPRSRSGDRTDPDLADVDIDRGIALDRLHDSGGLRRMTGRSASRNSTSANRRAGTAQGIARRALVLHPRKWWRRTAPLASRAASARIAARVDSRRVRRRRASASAGRRVCRGARATHVGLAWRRRSSACFVSAIRRPRWWGRRWSSLRPSANGTDSRAERNFPHRRYAAGGDVDPVDPAVLQLAQNSMVCGRGPAGLDRVGPTPQADRLARREYRADRVEDFQRIAHPTRGSRHIGRCAVGDRRQELVQEIAVAPCSSGRRCRAGRRSFAVRQMRRECVPVLGIDAIGGASPSCAAGGRGASACQPPWSIAICWPPSHGTRLDPLRPACASCITTAIFERLRAEAGPASARPRWRRCIDRGTG